MIPLIDKIIFSPNADGQSEKVHNFLTMYSVYQKLVLADTKINAELLNYDFLRYTENDAIEIHDKFTKGHARMQKLMHQQNSIEDCILVGGHSSCNSLQTIFEKLKAKQHHLNILDKKMRIFCVKKKIKMTF